MVGSISNHYIGVNSCWRCLGGRGVCGPNIFFYLFGMTRDEYNNVFDPSMSEKLKCVFNERGVCYWNETLQST